MSSPVPLPLPPEAPTDKVVARPAARERTLLLSTVVLAVTVPTATALHLQHRIDADLEPALADAVGTPVAIDHVEASLTGGLRLDGVRIGDLLEADAIEATMAPGTLLSGGLRPDEIRIDSPRLRLAVDADGGSNLDRLLARWRARRPAAGATGPGGGGRLRRIVVTGGDLIVDLGGRGELRLRGVELRPRRGGLRLVAGAAELAAGAGPWTVSGRFERAAADLRLPDLAVERALAVGGSLDAASIAADGGARASLRHASMSHRIDGRSGWRLGARLHRAGRDARVGARLDAGQLTIDMDDLPLALLGPLAPTGLDLVGARATGTAALVRRGPAIAVDLDAALTGVTLDHGRVAPRPVPVDGHLRLRAEATGPTVRVHTLELDRGGLRLRGNGTLELGAGEALPRRADLKLALLRGDCAAMLAGLPAPLRDRLGGLGLRGEAAAELAVSWDLANTEATSLAVDVDLDACQVMIEPVAADPRRLLEPFDHTWPDGSAARIGMGHGDYVTLRALPGHVLGAFVVAEDAAFWDHPGFDVEQIERSLAINLADRGLTRGGSTISQQLVKNVFLGHERTLARKLQEAVLTWRLEAHVGKRLILERYLNLIELGPQIYGVGAAARYWFGKSARELGPLESAFLAALTPAPTTLSARLHAAGRIDDATAERVRTVLRHMRRAGVIDQETYERLRSGRPTIRLPSVASTAP